MQSKMKKSLIFLVAILFMVSCGSLHNSQEKITAEQKSAQIQDSIHARTFTVEFNYVNPMRMPPHYLTTAYTLRLRGDSLVSELPYFGRAYRANPADNDRSPLSFSGRVGEARTIKGKKNDYTITLKTKNGIELLEYTLNLFSNGQAYLSVSSSDREPISFNGAIVL